jgi:hypothetical protein
MDTHMRPNMIAKQQRGTWLLIALNVVVVSIILSSGLVIAHSAAMPAARLIRDPLQIANLPPYAGLISNLGV